MLTILISKRSHYAKRTTGGDESGLPVARVGQTAYIGGVGDSIMQPTPRFDPAYGQVAYMAGALGKTYYASGIGGSQTDSILSRVNSLVIPKKVSIAFIEGGVNDVFYRGTGVSTVANADATIANLKAMFMAYVNDGVPLIVHNLITPWTGGSNSQNEEVDYINNAMKTWVETNYPQHMVFDTRAILGQDRSGQYAGNKWNIQPRYLVDTDSDALGVHFNDLGNQHWGWAVADAVFAKCEFSKPSAPSGVSFNNTTKQVSWSSDGAHEVTTNGGVSYTAATSPFTVGEKFRYTDRVGVRKVGSPRPSDTVFNTIPFTKTADANDLSIESSAGVNESNRIYTTAGTAWGNTALFEQTLPAGTNGGVGIKFIYPSKGFVFGFKTSHTNGGLNTINAGIRTYPDGTFRAYSDGTPTADIGFIDLDDEIWIFREGSALVIRTSGDDGATWSAVRYTFPLSTTAELSVGCDLYGNFGQFFYPRGQNLTS